MDAKGKTTETGATQPPLDDATQLIATGQLHRLEIARYRAEAVAARIGVDCDRMLRLVPPNRRQWREAIGEALLACRNIVSQAQASVGISEDEAAAPLAELQEVTRAAMQRVSEAMSVLLRMVPATTQDELFMGDARAIHDLAIATQSSAALDLVPSAGAESPMARPAQGDQAVSAGAGLKSTILVVDDDESVRKSLKQLLGRLGFAVIEAENGKLGLEKALNNPVDLVITDMDMPVMGGMELLRELKGSPGLNYLPVIIVSGQGDTEKAIKTIELGAEDYLSKPFDATLLKARVRSSLARKRLRDMDLDHMKRVTKLAAAADAVERDLYTPGSLKDLSGGHDAIARLARSFERMALTVRSREERLAQRLRLLRHEVGDAASGSFSMPVSADSPFSSGEMLGKRYQIVGQIGRGGMGMVYHATDAELNVDVAIKVVRADLVKQDPTLVDRLKSEIRLARQLSHPNIVRSHDLGEWSGTHYLTMEYVRGVSLSALVDKRGRLAVDAVIAIGIQLADALAVAHAQQIIHRDIKPANVLMDENGVLKVMDFGLAKSLAGEKGITQTGFVIGTPQYMAPEQLMGGTVDTRSDLFSVGVLLYECLCGRTPFDADNPVVVMTQMVDGTYPSLKHAVPEIPQSLEDLIAKLLQLEANKRVQTATELSRLLAEIELAPAPV